MIPVLYSAEEADFSSNGLGRLTDCLRCEVTQERNGIYECEFDYPIAGIHYDDITEGCIIMCRHSHQTDSQPFDIYGHSAPINGVVTFYAHHISYRLSSVIVMPFEAGSVSQAMARLKSYSITTNPFSFWTDRSTEGAFSVKVPSACRTLLGGAAGSILDVYGTGDYVFDKWAVRLYAEAGSDNGVTIRYGKNLMDITEEKTYNGTYSAVMPFWSNDDGTEVAYLPGLVYGSGMLSRTSVWTDENGDEVTDENAAAIDLTVPIVDAIPLDLSGDFDERPTETQLRQKAQSRLNSSKAWLPDQNLEVDFAALWQTEEYKDVAALQRVGLCDTVSVIYPELGVNVKTKVIKTVYDTLLERYTTIELGQPRTTLANQIKSGTTAAIMETVPTKTSMAQAIDYATKLIQGGLGGHVVMAMDEASGKPNEILIMDTEDTATAVNVLRINMNGIGFSRSGYNGPFETAWTIDGHFNASWIDTGVLSAELLKVGVIQPKTENGNYWNLDNDEFVLRNAKIHITTNDQDYDAIELNCGNWKNSFTPLEYRIENTGELTKFTIQAGALFGYTPNASEDDYVRRFIMQSNGSMWWYDVNGDQIATLQNGFLRLGGGSQNGALYINDTSGVRRWSITNNAIFGYNSNNINQLIAQNDGSMWWYDSSGNQIATMLNGDLSLNGLTGSVVTNINQLKKSDTWTSTAWAGLTCKAYREGKTVMITLRGTTTNNIGTANATVAVCTLPSGFTPVVTHTQYVVYGAEWKGQLVLNTDGTVNIGYTRQLTATSNALLPSGTNIYITATFVTGDD